MSEPLSADEIKRVMFGDVHCINFMHERRHASFQMIGQYDGAMSEECKNSFREQYEFWTRLIQEKETQ